VISYSLNVGKGRGKYHKQILALGLLVIITMMFFVWQKNNLIER